MTTRRQPNPNHPPSTPATAVVTHFDGTNPVTSTFCTPALQNACAKLHSSRPNPPNFVQSKCAAVFEGVG